LGGGGIMCVCAHDLLLLSKALLWIC
jgi:hypothetical protein